MKGFAIAVLLCAGGPMFAQSSTPFAAPPNLGQLFPAPSPQAPGLPQFKLEIPGKARHFSVLPAPNLKVPNPLTNLDADRGMVRKPKGFALRPGRPALRSDLYPNLKIQPTEIAQLGQFSCAPSAPKAEPIPRTFPKAKAEPIPTTWDLYRMVAVGDAGACNP